MWATTKGLKEGKLENGILVTSDGSKFELNEDGIWQPIKPINVVKPVEISTRKRKEVKSNEDQE